MFGFPCRFACKMKVVVSLIITVLFVILSSSLVRAQDTSSQLQSNTDAKKQEHESESEDEPFDDSVAEAIDRHVDEKPSLKLTQTEILDDLDTFPVEPESKVTGHDPATDFDDPDELESDSKEMPPANQFPSPFDQSTMDLSNVAQVVKFVLLIDIDCNALL